MMPSRTGLRSTWLGLAALLATTFTLGLAATSDAQILSDPRVAEFDPSPDHWVVLDSGESAVLRYELGVYQLGASTPLGKVDMGKPSPDADGKIRYDFSAQVTAWSLSGGEYEARVSAVGPEGAALSDPSNPFTFSTGSACTYSLSAATVSASASGGTYAVDVVTGTGCEWAVTTALSWVTPGVSGGLGSGPVAFAVQANSSSSSRTGTIGIGGQTLSVQQDAAPALCEYALSPTSASVDPAAGGSASFTVAATSGCSWIANTSASWITIAGGSGLGGGTVSLTVTPNSSTAARTGTVTVEGRTFTVTQAGAGPTCSYGVTPSAFSLGSSGGSGVVIVSTTDSNCGWTVSSNQSWLTPSVTSRSGSGEFSFTAKVNNGMTNRAATLTVGPWAVTVFQSGKPRRTK